MFPHDVDLLELTKKILEALDAGEFVFDPNDPRLDEPPSRSPFSNPPGNGKQPGGPQPKK